MKSLKIEFFWPFTLLNHLIEVLTSFSVAVAVDKKTKILCGQLSAYKASAFSHLASTLP